MISLKFIQIAAVIKAQNALFAVKKHAIGSSGLHIKSVYLTVLVTAASLLFDQAYQEDEGLPVESPAWPWP